MCMGKIKGIIMLKQNNQEKGKGFLFLFFFFQCSGDSRWELPKPDKGDLTRNCGEGTSPRQRNVRSPPPLEQAAEICIDRRHFARLNTWSSANQARTGLCCIKMLISLSLSFSPFLCLCVCVVLLHLVRQVRNWQAGQKGAAAAVRIGVAFFL